MADVGTGTTITFGTSGFAAALMSIDGPSRSRESVPTSHLGTSGYHTSMPGDLVNGGEINCTFQHNPDLSPPIPGAIETITITWPIPVGSSSGATWASSGYMTGYTPGASVDELMEASATIVLTGAPTDADAA